MAIQLLNESLSQSSDNQEAITETFLALIQHPEIKRSFTVSHCDWKVATFTLGEVGFIAAYSEIQEAARILSVKFKGAKACNLTTHSIDTVEGFFLSWAQEIV